MTNTRGKLAKFMHTHSRTDLVVVQYIGFASVYPTDQAGNILYSCTIEKFSRDRDAWRRLRKLGYTREGSKWRRVPKCEQPQITENEHACER